MIFSPFLRHDSPPPPPPWQLPLLQLPQGTCVEPAQPSNHAFRIAPVVIVSLWSARKVTWNGRMPRKLSLWSLATDAILVSSRAPSSFWPRCLMVRRKAVGGRGQKAGINDRGNNAIHSTSSIKLPATNKWLSIWSSVVKREPQTTPNHSLNQPRSAYPSYRCLPPMRIGRGSRRGTTIRFSGRSLPKFPEDKVLQ